MNSAFALLLGLFLCINIELVRCNAQNFSFLPHAYGTWHWSFEFHYPLQNSNSSGVYSFEPEYTRFHVNESETLPRVNQTLVLEFQPSTKNSALSSCSVTIIVDRDGEFFAWTNITLRYAYARLLPNMNASFASTFHIVESSTSQKFLTRTDDVYECASYIPIQFEEEAILTLANMTFQAFHVEKEPSADRFREVCPRDFRTNIPIAALTGGALLFLAICTAATIGIQHYRRSNKRKHT